MKRLLGGIILSFLVLSHVSAAPFSEGLGDNSSISDLILHHDTRLVMVGDSITNKNTDTASQSSMYWAAIRTWEPDNWRGIVTPTNGHSPTMQLFQVTAKNAVLKNKNLQNASNSLFSHNFTRIASSSAIDILWNLGVNQPTNTAIIGNQLLLTGVWNTDADWFENADVGARFIYLQSPYTVNQFKATTLRVGSNISEQSIVYTNMQNATALVRSVEAPVAVSAPGSVKFMIKTHGTYNESVNEDHFIWLGTRIYKTEGEGFQLDAMAVGGAKLRDFLANGRFATDDMLQAYLKETGNPNVFYIQLGANDGTFNQTWKNNMVELINRYDTLSAGNNATPHFILVAPYGTLNSITYTKALQAATLLHEIAINGTAQVTSDRIAFINLPGMMNSSIPQTCLKDNIHPSPAGADYVASLSWSQIANLSIPSPSC